MWKAKQSGILHKRCLFQVSSVATGQRWLQNTFFFKDICWLPLHLRNWIDEGLKKLANQTEGVKHTSLKKVHHRRCWPIWSMILIIIWMVFMVVLIFTIFSTRNPTTLILATCSPTSAQFSTSSLASQGCTPRGSSWKYFHNVNTNTFWWKYKCYLHGNEKTH